MIKRSLPLAELLTKSNYFLFGPRLTGKSSLIRSTLSHALVIDLLDDDVYEELLRRPKALEEKLSEKYKIVVIDEIQKLPKLLDEVHRLIEERSIRFLLTGSSVRKLKRGGANLLGGRAREAQLFPLTFNEIPDFDLIKYLNFGGIPKIYLSDEPEEDLQSYVRTYLAEEIKAEAAVRNYERFVRFLEVMALSNAKELNYQKLSSETAVPARTLEGYLEVLTDTLIAFELFPFEKTKKRKASTKSKFYFFDTGVANFLAQRLPLRPNHTEIGDSFEQFIIQEVRAYLSYSRIHKKMYYWRTRGYEVDLLIGEDVAIEIKFSQHIKDEHFKGLKALGEEKIIKKFIVVGRFESDGINDGISYMGYKTFLTDLWRGDVIKK